MSTTIIGLQHVGHAMRITAALAVLAVLSVSAVACSSTDGETGAGTGERDAGKVTVSAAEAGADAGDAAVVPAARAGECSSIKRECSCRRCCAAAHPAAYEVFAAARRECACGAQGACTNKCALSFCAGREPEDGDPCAKCLEAAPSCKESAREACKADASCAPYTTCVDESGCDHRARCRKPAP
jgi:hypothetical protein